MNNKKKTIIWVLILFFLSFSLIGIGVYLNSVVKSSYMMGKGIDFIQNSFYQYFVKNVNNVGDNYSLDGTIKFSLKSDYYKKNPASEEYRRILNLNQLNSNFSLKQNLKTKQAYIYIDEKIKNEKLLFLKLLIENNTEYFFLDGIADSYIDNGTCNYFETFQNDATMQKNIDYIYFSFFSSLKKSLKEEYFDRYEKVENIDGKDTIVIEIIMDISDNLIHTILNDTLDNMRKDSKANLILSSTFKDFDKYKIDSSTEFLKSNESYKISLSLLKSTHKPYKYQIDYSNGEEKKRYLYMGNNLEGTLYYLENDKITYIIDSYLEDELIKLSIQNSSKKLLGEFQYEKKDNNLNINYSFDDGSSLFFYL